MKKKMSIPFHKTHVSDREIEAVVEVMKSGWLTMGPKTIEFENPEIVPVATPAKAYPIWPIELYAISLFILF